MANISAIKLPSGNTYDLVDKTSGYVTTDEKLVVNQENSNNTYYPIISTSSTAASTKYIDTRGIKLDITNGTERSQGDITLVLGNSTAVNYDGNKAGLLQLYGPYSRYVQIQTPSSFTSDVYLTLPSSTGTLALTSNIKDATLTIQKNGVNVETFSANASSNKTANIVVNEVPSGGTSGQVLTKHSSTNYDVEWADASGGGAYIVTFTYDESEDVYTCDKTSQEIYEACISGENIVGVCYHGDPIDSGDIYICNQVYYEVEGSITYYYAKFSNVEAEGGHTSSVILWVSNSGVRNDYDFMYPVPDDRKINNKDLSSDITLTASDVGALPDTTTIPSKTSDLTNDSGFITGMTILSYGSSTWQNFIDAYNANKIVYCRASSNSNPASGSQTRLAFMAYVNNAATPTEVEFQYYRSVSSHTASQQGDQVYVYKLNKTNGWSVTVREASVKVVAGTGLGGTYSNGTMTLTGPTKVSDLTNDSGFITGYTETDPVFSASAAAGITSSNISSWNGKQDALVSGTNIKTINNQSILGSGNITVSTTAAQIIRWTEST